MSYELAGIVSKKQCGGAMRRCLLFTLAGRANNDGTGIYASIATLAVDSEMSERSVQMHMKDFLAEGLLCVTGQRKCRNGYTTEYAIVVASLESLPDLNRKKSRAQHVRPEESTGAQDARVQDLHRCTISTPRGAGAAPLPVQELHPNLSLEPIREPVPRANPVKDGFDAAWKRWPKFRASDKAKSWERWKKVYDPRMASAIEVYLKSPDALKPDRDTGKAHGYVPAFEVWLNGKAAFWLEQVAEVQADTPANIDEEFERRFYAAGAQR